jgi:SAM-dependent methyltransferase
VPPSSLFGGLDDHAWRWLNLDGRDQCPFLADYLPGLGDPELEAEFVGLSGRDALAVGFKVYELFKALYEDHVGSLTPDQRVLEFGCGWGRVTRFFLKDVAPENLVGIDEQERAINACVETNRWCRFERCEAFPPTVLDTASFDLIYAFAVFCHLSEEAHSSWLEEFARLLRPGGTLLLTTFPRAFLENLDAHLVDQFSPSEPWLAAYDRGEFCYRAMGETTPHFGTAFIPEQYVRQCWTEHFLIRDYLSAPELMQNIIVCEKSA